ncbi:MAG: hypothetical protein JXQ75_13605 [Phycisphaerae bacterium]|nr:hypothetical protein [Phycisphaerae bacterium]
MIRNIWAMSAICLLYVSACGPTIRTITPTGKQPLESVVVEGEGLDHATIFVDGGPVGAPLFSYPKPEVFIPVQRKDGVTTTATVQMSAQNEGGAGNVVMYSALDVPVNAPAVSIDAILPPTRMQFSNLITITVFGGGIFPGARNAGVGRPHAGPPDVQAVPVAGGPNVPATDVVCLTENSIQVFFPASLPRGLYKLYVKNDDRYGGVSGTSAVTFEWK